MTDPTFSHLVSLLLRAREYLVSAPFAGCTSLVRDIDEAFPRVKTPMPPAANGPHSAPEITGRVGQVYVQPAANAFLFQVQGATGWYEVEAGPNYNLAFGIVMGAKAKGANVSVDLNGTGSVYGQPAVNNIYG